MTIGYMRLYILDYIKKIESIDQGNFYSFLIA